MKQGIGEIRHHCSWMKTLIISLIRAGFTILSDSLRKKDMSFLMIFGEECERMHDYTNSLRLLEEGLNRLRINSGVGGLHPGPVPTISQPRGTVLYDATYLAANDKLRS